MSKADKQQEPAPAPTATPSTTPAQPKQVCEVCGKDLAEEKSDFVKLAWIKFRKRLCQEDYLAAKAGAR